MDWSKLLDPFKTLFQDRVVVTAILSAFGAVVVNLIPAVQPYMSLIVPALIAVILLAAGGSAVAQARVAPINAQTKLVEAQVVLARTQNAATWMPHPQG